MWDVINGFLLLGCGANDARPVQMDLNRETPEVLDGECYAEPIYISLESLPAKFDGPMSFGSCLPRFTRDARAQLLEDHFAEKFQSLCEPQQSDDASHIGNNDKYNPGPRPTGLLSPGEYLYESDPELVIKMILHPGGAFTYTEQSVMGFIKPRVPTRLTLWRVVDDVLVLTSRETGSYTFTLQKAKNSRTVEQQIQCVKIPVAQILDRFALLPFKQEAEPFLGHQTVPKHRCIGGTIDPASASLKDPEIESQRMPRKDFERGLELCGILEQAGTSGLAQLKNDEDGNVGVEELQLLGEAHGIASLEQMEQLREGIIATHGSLQDAFCLLAGSSHGTLALSDFEERLRQHRGPRKDAKRDEGKLKDMVEKADSNEMRQMFNALDVTNDGVVDWNDFQSLQYGAVILNLRLVDHFCQFVRNHFRKGNSDACFRRAFESLNVRKYGSSKEHLDLEEFVSGATSLIGYPHEHVAREVFHLIDRNFNYKITVKEISYLQHFNSSRFLDGLERFKNMVDEKCGSLDKCFKMLLWEQSQLTGKPNPCSVECSTFETFCRKLGIKSPIDIRTMFIFLDGATGSNASGYISAPEWAILKGFDSKFHRRPCSKLPSLIKSTYGTYQECFNQIYKEWLPQQLVDRLDRLALTQACMSCGFNPDGSGSTSPSQVSGRHSPAARKRVRNPGAAIGINEPQRMALTDWTGQPRCTANLPIRHFKLPGILPNLQEGTTLSSGRGRPKTVSAIEWGWRSKLDPGQR
eukprot:gnl/MRDRNA2_/MRDRNA2_160106_c0_seq1.p1 gnl/MRDRNA2_/MRDRNA2_160106_c0~~gnl/MRDRNA2_/MRDRNA2_160106_c0_seq1.p1  ORF type:complete len:880 (+),score=137.54 gnl/MRDRNA2_/MRDRNA2_160106_c0_seq1:388-2640(+)